MAIQMSKFFQKHLKYLIAVILTLQLSVAWGAVLPFVGEKFKITVQAPEAPELEKQLQNFIDDQQKTNEQLKQIDDKNLYGKLLSAILRKKLEAQGYYSFGLSYSDIDNRIVFSVQPGERATINTIKVNQPEFVEEDLRAVVANQRLAPGEPLLAEEVLAGEKKLKEYINNKYCFVNPKLSRTITMNTVTKKADIFFNLETTVGKSVSKISFTGNETIDDEFLTNVVQIPKSCFKQSAVNKAQIALLQTGLLSSASPETKVLNENEVEIIFQVNERKHKTQSIGIGYSTEEQVRLSLGWENRNWRGNGKKLSTEFKISQLSTQLDGSLRVPQFKHPDLDLLVQAELSDTRVEAFDAVSAETSAILEYSFNRYWLGSFGVATEYSKIDSSDQNEIFRLVSLPLSLRFDTSNNLLDPTEGAIWTFSVQPFTDLASTDTQFTQYATSLALYSSPAVWRFNQQKTKSFTLATRLATGSIAGETLSTVPADHRYYVGGGGSVRGFDYQSLSPTDGDAIIGGLSFIEAAAELRLRLTTSWGASVFVDSGAGFAEQDPDFSARLSVGGGIGLRYLTSFAPIRIDIAWPLSSPNEFETKPQLYVGLKQAF